MEKNVRSDFLKITNTFQNFFFLIYQLCNNALKKKNSYMFGRLGNRFLFIKLDNFHYSNTLFWKNLFVETYFLTFDWAI